MVPGSFRVYVFYFYLILDSLAKCQNRSHLQYLVQHMSLLLIVDKVQWTEICFFLAEGCL